MTFSACWRLFCRMASERRLFRTVQEEVPETARDCYINVFRAKVVPERIRSFSMPADGIVSNWIPADGRVRRDTIIATVNEDEIEMERRELEVKILKDRIAKEEELSELEKQLEEMKFYSSLSREERQYASKQPEGGQRAEKSLKDKIELTKKELAMVGDKARLDFSKKEEKYILKMPFDGKLQYQFSFPRDNSVSLYLDGGGQPLLPFVMIPPIILPFP